MIFQYVKADIMLNSIWMYLLIIGTVLGANVTTLPPIFILLIITLTFVINQFYYDQTKYVNRFFIGLPVPKKMIVQSRYISMIMIALFYILIHWFLGFTGVEMHYVFHWQDIVAVMSMQLIVLAVVIPIFYLIPSFMIAVGITLILLLFGTFYFLDGLVFVLGWEDEIIFNDIDPGLVLFIEKYIPYQPYLLASISSVALLYLSLKLSEYIFRLRNW